MNYDETDIPVGYDRARDHGPENVALWMNAISSFAEFRGINTILDLGCGTGRYSQGLAAHFDADLIGVDPSSAMLRQAAAKNTGASVRYVLGHAEAIPLQEDGIDLIFMSMVFHHFVDPAAAARECRRVLREGGIAFLRAGSRERASLYPYVEFFPTSVPIIQDLLSTRAFMRETFETAGFRTAASDVVTQMVAPSYAAFAEKLLHRGDSVLAQLPRAEFEAGLEAVRRHASLARQDPVYEAIDFFVFQ